MNLLKRYAKIAALFLVLACAALALSGCADFSSLTDTADEAEPTPVPPLSAPLFTELGALYAYYDRVDFTDTLESVTQKLGEPTQKDATAQGVTYHWVDESGYGVVATFFASGKLQCKVLEFKDIRQFGRVSNCTNIEYATNMSTDFPYSMVAAVMDGTPVEIMQLLEDEAKPEEVSRLVIWANEEDCSAQMLFDHQSLLKKSSYSFPTT